MSQKMLQESKALVELLILLISYKSSTVGQSQTKQLLRPVLQLLTEISLGKCIHDVVVAGGALKGLAMRSRNNLTRT